MADKKKTEQKKELRDSEGLRVSTVHDESAPKKGESLNAAAREAFEAEVAADAAPDPDEEARKVEEWEKFLASR